MRRRILWTTFWLTMAFWLGNAWGCGRMKTGHVLALQPAPHIDLPAAAEAQPRQLAPPLPGAVPALSLTAAAPATPTIAATQPLAPADLARQEFWPRIIIGPASGVASHHPVYFRDVAWPRSRGARQSQLLSEQLTAALEGSLSGNMSFGNAADAMVQPAKLATDFGLLPAKMALQPPWARVTTP